jgi:diguanylate cyclase (GGDEF)-like protein
MRIRTRFILVLGVLLVGTTVLGVLALRGLSDLHRSTAELPASVGETVSNGSAHAALLRVTGDMEAHALAADEATKSNLKPEIEEAITVADEDLADMRARYADRPIELQYTLVQRKALQDLVGLWRSRLLDRTDERSRLIGYEQVRRVSEPMEEAGAALARRDIELARTTREAAHARFVRSRNMAASALVITLVLGIAFAFWLTRTVVPRTRRYSQFARRVSEGHLAERIDVTGSDELAELGRTLNAMVADRELERAYVETQAEFAEVLQGASSEEEAHQVLQIHLERCIDGGSVGVFNRNNSADRLELRTVVEEESPLAATVTDAAPRSCLAVRFARPHEEGDGRRPLLSCEVCGGIPGTKTCNPLLVGGEVIGSVLVAREDGLDGGEKARLADSIVQAAPVLANLRNLTIAELRAATDSLTGLPNSRAVRDTVKRMCAEAGRTTAPLAAALLDLDHFKLINDTFGHGRGDDVLASVGAALRDTVRESDFVGRLGGEEFLVLLPNTDREGAVVACEKVREAIARIEIPELERRVTASVGIALVPDHAGDAEDLLRAADRALYAAKEAGRNRVAVANRHGSSARLGRGTAPLRSLADQS